MKLGTRRAVPPNTREWIQTPLFVYGTLRRGQHNYMRLLAGYTVSEIPATISGMRLYTVGHFPVMVEGEPGEVVHGEWMIVHPIVYAHVLEMLDRLEGYNPTAADGNASGLYRREKRRVQLASGSEALAWMYIGNPAMLEAMPHALIPDGNWLTFYAELTGRTAVPRPFRTRRAGEN